MDKAEEFAYSKYPKDRKGVLCKLARKSIIDGYHQAEKDLELTWEDMECIIKHYQDIMAEKSRVFVRAEDYQELLKRFKEKKK